MIREVVWTRAAESDLQATFQELEDLQPGHGVNLIRVVDAQISLLQQFAEMAPIFEAPIRRLVLKERRYGLFYAVEGRRIVLHAFSDLRRDPELLRSRFRKLIGP